MKSNANDVSITARSSSYVGSKSRRFLYGRIAIRNIEVNGKWQSRRTAQCRRSGAAAVICGSGYVHSPVHRAGDGYAKQIRDIWSYRGQLNISY